MATPEHIKKTHALLSALTHPERRKILRAMDGRRETCPRDLAKELGKALDNVSYHVRVLAVCGAVEPLRTEPAGSSTMHFYRMSLKPRWAREVLDATAEEQPGKDG
jgi:DNA-binding transcriptional ArsR family regulator